MSTNDYLIKIAVQEKRIKDLNQILTLVNRYAEEQNDFVLHGLLNQKNMPPDFEKVIDDNFDELLNKKDGK